MKNLIFENMDIWGNNQFIMHPIAVIPLKEIIRLSDSCPKYIHIANHVHFFAVDTDGCVSTYNREICGVFEGMEHLSEVAKLKDLDIFPFIFDVQKLRPLKTMSIRKAVYKVAFKLQSNTSSIFLDRHKVACVELGILEKYGIPKSITRWKARIDVEFEEIIIDTDSAGYDPSGNIELVETFEDVSDLQCELSSYGNDDICVLPFVVLPGGARDIRGEL